MLHGFFSVKTNRETTKFIMHCPSLLEVLFPMDDTLFLLVGNIGVHFGYAQWNKCLEAYQTINASSPKDFLECIHWSSLLNIHKVMWVHKQINITNLSLFIQGGLFLGGIHSNVPSNVSLSKDFHHSLLPLFKTCLERRLRRRLL